MVKARAGEAAVSPQLLCEAFGALLRPRSGQHAEGARIAALLTEREAEVLARIVDGEDTRRIAAGLGVATSTARTHVQRLLTKLGAATRVAAAALAVRTGVLDHLPGGPAAGSAG
jgi:DNA-binding NarL/FixJ family response regulator